MRIEFVDYKDEPCLYCGKLCTENEYCVIVTNELGSECIRQLKEPGAIKRTWGDLVYQPERSKREDSQQCEMRCSEHCGNTVTEAL